MFNHKQPSYWTRMYSLGLIVGYLSAFSMNANSATNKNWLTAGGSNDGSRYSALDRISTANVGLLAEEFSFRTGVSGSHMGEPLVVDDILYVVTPYPNKLIAYDLKTGNKLWTYAPKIDEFSKGVNCCGGINRGAAYADGKIVFNLLDNTVVAVNALTGKKVWSRKLADSHTGVTMTIAPLIVKDKVITASSSGEMGVRGWVEALSLKNGKPLWRAYHTGPDNDVLIGQNFRDNSVYYRGKVDQGATSWPNKRAYMLGGSAAWAYLTYDAELDLLFYGTSQPGVWSSEMRCDPDAYKQDIHSCDNKWGDSIFARKPDTGEAVWAYQFTPHDSWDYDAASENIPVNQTVITTDKQNNQHTHNKLLVHFNKNGFAYTFDRATGEVLSANQFVPEVNWANGINLETGLPNVDEKKRVVQGKTTEKICPSVLGAKGWEPAAYSEKTQLFYAPTFNLCSSLKTMKAEFISGAPYMGMDLNFVAPSDLTFASELIAWDAVQGKKLWGVKETSQIYAGVLATAGNLVFYSTKKPEFKAIDANNGTVLFSQSLACNAVGNPITFMGSDNIQRVAVFSDDNCQPSNRQGGVVHVYKLRQP